MPVGGLYEAIVPVETQDETERRQALHKAMWQVLVKLTGDSAIVDDERAKTLINDAQRYVQQYRYLEPATDGSEAGLRLWTGFDPAAVDEALRRLGIATWGRERPATLVWLAVEDDRGRRLVGMEQTSPYLNLLARRARERGLPLLLPLMDLEDTARLSATAIFDADREAIKDASGRYPADTVLALSLSGVDSERATARWTLMTGEADGDKWRTEGGSAEEAIAGGVERLADTLARRYAPKTFAGQARRIRLAVSDVDGFDDYARTQRYLAGLSSISRVDVVAVEPGRVVFELESLGGEESFEQAVAIGRTLRPAEGDGGDENTRSYRLMP